MAAGGAHQPFIQKDLMKLSPEQRQQVWSALLSAFNPQSLKRLLDFKLGGRDLDTIVPTATDFQDRCYELVKSADKAGWVGDLIRAAIADQSGNEELQRLVAELGLKMESTGREQAVPAGPGRDTSAVPLAPEGFRTDLARIRADEYWYSEDYEDDLANLRDHLPRLRAYARGLVPRRRENLKQSVLCELQLADMIDGTLSDIDIFEIGLNILLDPLWSYNPADQTRYIQWFRDRSGNVLKRLADLQDLGEDPPSGPDAGAARPGSPLSGFIEELRGLQTSDPGRLDERRTLLSMDSGLGAVLGAVVSYLRDTPAEARRNVEIIRELLTSASVFIDQTAQAERRHPAGRDSRPFLSPSEGRALRKSCDNGIDDLDSYDRANRDAISAQERAGPASVGGRADPHGLRQARRHFIDKLVVLQRRITDFNGRRYDGRAAAQPSEPETRPPRPAP